MSRAAIAPGSITATMGQAHILGNVRATKGNRNDVIQAHVLPPNLLSADATDTAISLEDECSADRNIRQRLRLGPPTMEAPERRLPCMLRVGFSPLPVSFIRCISMSSGIFTLLGIVLFFVPKM